MGLLDWFGKGKGEAPVSKSARDVARYARLVESKLSQDYDRQDAIEQLGKLGTAASCEALLKRFNWSMDPSITDQDEKESAARGIIAAGKVALEPLRAYCKRAESLTWPLKILKEIVEPAHYVEELLAALDQFDTEYLRNPEPKIQLLGALSEHPTEDVRVALLPFVQDVSEPVRYAAVVAVLAIDNAASAEALVAGIEHEESLRVKNRVASGLAEKGWPVPLELREACADSLPPGFRLVGEFVRANS
ncbi:MAG: HEAT repeat domain-containing protein [Polyangiaceae bacterium]|nr:HEAT repeat domain-containing protein [Polyangiaceae bacterium]